MLNIGDGDGTGFGFGDCWGAPMDGSGYGCGYGDGFGDGYDERTGAGYGEGYGFGFGYSDSYGGGHGYGGGYGLSIDDGSGHGFYGYIVPCEDFAGFSTWILPTWGIVGIGCEIHSADVWRAEWRDIAQRHGVQPTAVLSAEIEALCVCAHGARETAAPDPGTGTGWS